MPFDPRSRPYGPVRRDQQPEPLRSGAPGRRYLQSVLPEAWRFAHQSALDLGHRLCPLPWPERAQVLDTHFVRQAEAMLREEGLSALVDVSVGAAEAKLEVQERAARFTAWSRGILTAVLLNLDEPLAIIAPEQALTYLLGRDLTMAKTAARWTTDQGMAALAEVLQGLPGYALVLLASNPNDTAERFLARDAFWKAVTRDP